MSTSELLLLAPSSFGRAPSSRLPRRVLRTLLEVRNARYFFGARAGRAAARFDVFKATAARISVFSAFSLILSSS